MNYYKHNFRMLSLFEASYPVVILTLYFSYSIPNEECMKHIDKQKGFTQSANIIGHLRPLACFPFFQFNMWSLQLFQTHTCPSAEEFQASQAKYYDWLVMFGSSFALPKSVLQTQWTQCNQMSALVFHLSVEEGKTSPLYLIHLNSSMLI